MEANMTWNYFEQLKQKFVFTNTERFNKRFKKILLTFNCLSYLSKCDWVTINLPGGPMNNPYFVLATIMVSMT